jgi:hypothetical protein
MPRPLLPFVLGTTLLLHSTLALALGFGTTRLQSALGQRLDFAATLTVELDQTVSRDCVSAEVQAGDYPVSPRNVRAVLQMTADPTRPVVRVTTDVAIDEPVVTIDVSIGCGSKLARRFVAFVDPPGMRLAEADAAEPMPLPRRIDAQTASLADLARQADAGRRGVRGDVPAKSVSRPPRSRQAASMSRSVVASGATLPAANSPRASRTARTRTALGPAPRSGGARLQLDRPTLLAAAPATAPSAPAPIADAVVALAASAPAVRPASIDPVAAVPAGPAASDAAAADQRLRALEADVARARSESVATQKTIATLQARLRQAEGERFPNVVVYVLFAVALLAVLVAVALWWLRPRQRRRARWFDAQANQQARADSRRPERPFVLPESPSSPIPMPSETPSFWSHAPASGPVSERPSAIGGLEVTTVLGPEWKRPGPETQSGFAAGLDEEDGDALSMEALIDLEQQAEFFVVLGQDEAAIALLERHTRGSAGNSPLPYLQLLEIHQRRGDQPAYERVAQSFRERFDAEAPEWAADVHLGRHLDDYPQAVARLQSLWETPMSAMGMLEELLFRREAADGTYDFPAYSDLLFLYAIARDISANVETDQGSIDLFLPLDDPQAGSVFAELGGPSGPVDLDVTDWPEDAAMTDVSSTPRTRAGRAG